MQNIQATSIIKKYYECYFTHANKENTPNY